MAEAFVLEGKILLDAQRVINDLEKVDNKAKNTGNTFDKISRKIGDFGKSLDKWVTRGLTAGGVALGAFGIKAIDTASDLQEVQNVVDTTFKSNASIINQWAKEAPEAIGMSELAYKQYAGTMGAMLKSMGMTSEQTKNMSGNIVDLAGDMASFYNLDHEVAFEKIRSGISGETEPLKQLGINMSVTNLEAYRLAQGLKKPYNQMSQSEQVMLRYNYLFEQTADAQGDFSKTSDGFANQLRILQLRFQTLAAEIGEKLMPHALKFVSWANENMDKLPILVGILGGLLVTVKGFFIVTKIVEAMQTWKKVTEGVTVAQIALNTATKANVIGILISAIIALVGYLTYLWNTNENFKNAVISAWELVKEKAIEVFTRVVSFFKEDIPNAIKSAKTFFTEKVPNYFSEMGTKIKNKIKLIGDSIKAFFTETIPGIFNDIGDWFSGLPYMFGQWLGAVYLQFVAWGNSISNFFTVTVPKWIDDIGMWFSNLPERIKVWFNQSIADARQWLSDMYISCQTSISQFISDVGIWFSQLPGRVKTWFIETISATKQWGSDMYNTAKTHVMDTVNGIVSWFSDLPSKMLDIGRNIVEGIANGIKSAKDSVMNTITGIKDGIVNGFKNKLGIHSPSRVMKEEVGKYIPQGIGLGIEEESKKTDDTIEKMINRTVAISSKVAVNPINTKPFISNDNKNSITNELLKTMIQKLDIIANKNPNLEVDGRELMRVVAPYQNEFEEYNNRFAY